VFDLPPQGLAVVAVVVVALCQQAFGEFLHHTPSSLARKGA
jgi:hypothetical protein